MARARDLNHGTEKVIAVIGDGALTGGMAFEALNDAGISKKNKNLGHNFFMGQSFNPQNYYVNSKNRTKRNVFGGLFIH